MFLRAPNNFEMLYKCKIEPTGEKLYKLKPEAIAPRLPLFPTHPDVSHIEEEIAIKMPHSEYERFIKDYNQFMGIMKTASTNPMIRDQYHQLLMLVEIMK